MTSFLRREQKTWLLAVFLVLFTSIVATTAPAAEPAEEAIRLDHVRAYIERTRGWRVEEYSLRPMAVDANAEQLPVYRVVPDTRVRRTPLEMYPVDIFLDSRSGEVVGENVVRPTPGSPQAASGDAP